MTDHASRSRRTAIACDPAISTESTTSPWYTQSEKKRFASLEGVVTSSPIASTIRPAKAAANAERVQTRWTLMLSFSVLRYRRFRRGRLLRLRRRGASASAPRNDDDRPFTTAHTATTP